MQIADGTEKRVRALAIYRQYIDVNGNLFLTLPDKIQEELDNKLSSFAEQEEENGHFDYNFEPDPMVFNSAQDYVLSQMESDTFPRFLSSEIATKLAKEYTDRYVHNLGLAEANLL